MLRRNPFQSQFYRVRETVIYAPGIKTTSSMLEFQIKKYPYKYSQRLSIPLNKIPSLSSMLMVWAEASKRFISKRRALLFITPKRNVTSLSEIQIKPTGISPDRVRCKWEETFFCVIKPRVTIHTFYPSLVNNKYLCVSQFRNIWFT